MSITIWNIGTEANIGIALRAGVNLRSDSAVRTVFEISNSV